MNGGAAIFDLDRTVLSRASGPVLDEALAAENLGARMRLPGQGIAFRLYDLLGESAPAMAMARAAARAARGWPVEGVRRAGRAAVPALEALVNPYVAPLMREHREARRSLVLATTTPYDLVEPFASHLGFDAVVATRWAQRDGAYTGGVDGEFVWSLGKLAAVRRWAARSEVDLRSSYAYSDSVYDVPLLLAVGHPVAVNPDPRLYAFALLSRWPVRSLDAPEGVPKLAGLEPFDLVQVLARPELFPYARFDLGPPDQIPSEGPAIVVSNHRSYFDVAALGLTVLRRGRPLRFLGKREVFDAPIVGHLARAFGGIRVDRGSGSDQPLRRAAQVLEAGELVAVLPQGTIPRGRDFFDPELRGRTGAARLAAMTGAPVIPIGLWGTERVWPRSSRLPRVANVTSPPLVKTRVGTPVSLTYEDPVTDTAAIMTSIIDLLPPEAHEWREPSEEEVAMANPPGHRPESPDPPRARLHVVGRGGSDAEGHHGRGDPAHVAPDPPSRVSGATDAPAQAGSKIRKPAKHGKAGKAHKGPKSSKASKSIKSGKAARTLA